MPTPTHVKSPYNFVPAVTEDKVYKPNWANEASHDIPLRDSESGEIVISIKAETPIFIRNGHSEEKVENEFSNIEIDGKKRYFLPASSIKGMLRNVVEIMSFSRLSPAMGSKKEDEEIFGMRDMSNADYSKGEIRDLKSGWLYKDASGKYHINYCINHRVSLANLEMEFKLPYGSLKGINAVEKYKSCSFFDFNKSYLFSKKGDLGTFVGHEYKFDSSGDFEGVPVMFGDIDNKRYDFVFSKFEKDAKTFEVSDELMNSFLAIDSKNGQSLFEYFQNSKFPKIPVFFKAYGKAVRHFGFSKLYRLNNSYFLNQLEPFKSYSNGEKPLDFAQVLFGYSDGEKGLKGRVFISNALDVIGTAIPQPLDERILNSPKPSFYPAYLKQDGINGKLKGENKYNTYHNSDSYLSGFKRYPVHNSIKRNGITENENISPSFYPLNSGATFKCVIRYHNLKTIEVGAIVSALSFHNNQDKFFHSIGGVKPYGFGKISIAVSNINNYITHLQIFEAEMNKHIKQSWIESEQVKELLSMCSSNVLRDELLVYPQIEPVNEFNEYKENRLFLEPYSQRNGISKINSLITDKFNLLIKEKEDEEKRIKVEMNRRKIEDAEKLAEEEKQIQEAKRLKTLEDLDNKLIADQIAKGLNLAAINNRKTIEAVSRTLKNWKEKLGGEIGADEMHKLRLKFTEIWLSIKKEKEKVEWKQHCLKDLKSLEIYLNEEQIDKVTEYLNGL